MPGSHPSVAAAAAPSDAAWRDQLQLRSSLVPRRPRPASCSDSPAAQQPEEPRHDGEQDALLRLEKRANHMRREGEAVEYRSPATFTKKRFQAAGPGVPAAAVGARLPMTAFATGQPAGEVLVNGQVHCRDALVASERWVGNSPLSTRRQYVKAQSDLGPRSSSSGKFRAVPAQSSGSNQNLSGRLRQLLHIF